MSVSRHLLKNCVSNHMGYEWVGNSCYLDTVLWTLFSSPTPFIDKKILFVRPPTEKIRSCGSGRDDWDEEIFLEFQMQFQKAAYYFRCGEGSKDCSSFRKLYKKWYERCPHLRTKIRFHSSEQQEAQEFLQFILSLYGMNGKENHGAVSKEEFYYGVSKVPRTDTIWKFIRARKDKTQSLVWNVPYHVLRNTSSQQRTLENFSSRHDDIWNITKQYKGCNFNSIRTIHSLVKFADLMIFSLERTNPLQQTVSHFRIHIPETITDQKGKTLTLMGIICHQGESTNSGHYTAFHYSTTDKQWYYYDDMNPPLQKIGTWENMLSIRRVFTHCVLLFYTKL